MCICYRFNCIIVVNISSVSRGRVALRKLHWCLYNLYISQTAKGLLNKSPVTSILSVKHFDSLGSSKLIFRFPTIKGINMLSRSMNLNISSIDSQHTALYLLCGLYRHANNHFSLRMMTSIMSDSMGDVTAFCVVNGCWLRFWVAGSISPCDGW